MKHRIRIALIALIAVTATVASAEQQPIADVVPNRSVEVVPGPAQDSLAPGLDENARKKIEAIRISRMTEALNLDEKTASKFIPAVTALEQQRRQAMHQHRQAMMVLRREVHGTQADMSRLKETIERFIASQREIMKLREKEFGTAKEYLTTEQLARYLIFQQDFLQEIRELVSGMRGMGPGLRGPRQGPRRGPGNQGFGSPRDQ